MFPKYKVKIVEATSPYELERRINEVMEDVDVKGFEVQDIKYVMTPMPGGKVSRAGVFYMACVLFRKC